MATRTISARTLATLLGPEVLAGHPAYQSLADAVRRLLGDGRVMLGTRLPSERELTEALGVSRTTVGSAYAVLREDGYLVTRRGAGSTASLPGGAPRRTAFGPPRPEAEDALDLTSAALPAAPGCTEAVERAVRALPRHLAGTGYHPLGLPDLRAAVAGWYAVRGLPTTADQVVVTCGAHAALSTILRGRLDHGDRVLLESPTYPGALAAVRRSGLRAVGVPMAPGGWDVDGIAATVRQSSPALAYLVPDFHNPTGLLMDDATRSALAAVFARTRTAVVVDETFVELSLTDTAMPLPFAAHAPGALTVGGVSKAFWGGLRVGWLRAPAEDVAALVDARHSLDLGTPVLDQLVAVELLAQRDAALAARRATVREQRDALVTAVRDRLPRWRFRVPTGGLALWCELPEPRSSVVVAAAERHGVLLASGGQFGVEGGLERFLRLPFILPPDELTEAVARIARAWDASLDESGGVAPRARLIA